MVRFLCVALSLGLSACATMVDVRKDLSSRYVGHRQEVAFDRFGVPNKELNIAGRRAYVWELGAGECTLKMEVDNGIIIDVRTQGLSAGWCELYTKG